MSVTIKPNNKTVPQQTVSSIRSLIARQYAVGDILPSHRELAEMLSVSHPSVTEAMKVLAAQGLVNPVQRKGTIVTRRPSKELSELSQIVVVPRGELEFLFSGYRGQMLAGLGQKIEEHNMNLTLFPRQAKDNKVSLINEISHIADGVVLQGVFDEQFINDCMALELPLVLMDHYAPDTGADCVVCDNFTAGHHVVTHLAELGHKNIAYMRQSLKISSDSDNIERLQAFEDAISSLKLSQGAVFGIDSRKPADNSKTMSTISDMINSEENSLTAFVTSDDTTASWLIRALQKNGFKVPDDISVIAIAQTDQGVLRDVAHISGCVMNFKDMGIKALETLERRCLEYNAPPFVVRIDYDFLEGRTCRAVSC